MGQEQSVESDNDVQNGDSTTTKSGYRVMKVFRGSAAARCGLRAFEDFVVGIKGSPVDGDNAVLGEILASHENHDIELDVYNVIDGAHRTLTLRPAKWNGPGLLGAAVRYESVDGAADNVLHVVDVAPNSPADSAGLVPSSDYIVGSPAQVFRAPADFHNLVAECTDNNSAASVMVYSTATSRVVSEFSCCESEFLLTRKSAKRRIAASGWVGRRGCVRMRTSYWAFAQD